MAPAGTSICTDLRKTCCECSLRPPSGAPTTGPANLTATEVIVTIPTTGPINLTAEIQTVPETGPVNLTALAQPNTGPVNLSAIKLIPDTGPVNLVAEIETAPVSGPKDLTAEVIEIPAFGPSNLSGVHLAPTVGPTNGEAHQPTFCNALPESFCLTLSNAGYLNSTIYVTRDPNNECSYISDAQFADATHPFSEINFFIDEGTQSFEIGSQSWPGAYTGGLSQLSNLPLNFSMEQGISGNHILGWHDTYVYTLSACSRNNSPNAPVTGPSNLSLNTTAVGVQKWDLRMLIDWPTEIYMGYSESITPTSARVFTTPEDFDNYYSNPQAGQEEGEVTQGTGTPCGGFAYNIRRFLCGINYKDAQDSNGNYFVTADNSNFLSDTGDGTAANPTMIYAYPKAAAFHGTARQGPTLAYKNLFGNSLYQTWNIGYKNFNTLQNYTSRVRPKNLGAGIDGYSFQQIDGTNSDFQTGLGFGLSLGFFGSTVGNEGGIIYVMYDDTGEYGGGFVAVLVNEVDRTGGGFTTFTVLKKLDNYANAKDPWNPFGTYVYTDGVYNTLLHVATAAFDAETLDSATADRPKGYDPDTNVGDMCLPFSVRYRVPNSAEDIIEVDCVNVANYL